MPGTVQTIVVAASIALCAAPIRARDAQSDKSEVTGLIHQWADARVKGDTAFLERFYGPELRIYQMNGGIVERKDDIALFAARAIQPEWIRNTEIDAHVYGDTAVISSIESLRGSYRGRVGELSMRVLNVLARRDGHWQLVASQFTPIAPPRPGG